MKATELQKKMRGRNIALLIVLASWAVLMAIVAFVKMSGLA